MKYLKISLSAFAFLFMAFSLNAQSCHDAKAEKGACCAKKQKCSSNSSAASDAKTSTTLVANIAEGQSETFKVYGNCGMCKRRIESALENVEGVQSADWDVDTKMLKVSYDSESITLDDIQKKIAAVGHDAGKYRAEDTVYNELHGCCQYDRAKI